MGLLIAMKGFADTVQAHSIHISRNTGWLKCFVHRLAAQAFQRPPGHLLTTQAPPTWIKVNMLVNPEKAWLVTINPIYCSCNDAILINTLSTSAPSIESYQDILPVVTRTKQHAPAYWTLSCQHLPLQSMPLRVAAVLHGQELQASDPVLLL